jgi:signal transduction histidine kinase
VDGNLNYFVLRLGPVIAAGRTVAALICCESILSLKQSQDNLEHERHVLKQLLEIQERERQLVSYEIHDGLSQYLTGAMMHLQALEHAASTSVFATHEHRRDLDESLRLLRAAVDESRRLIGGLRPPALDELGIVEAVETLAADARGFIAKVDFQHRLDAGRLPAPLETTIFRIVQESLSNARKHALASTVTILLDQPDPAHVSIVVRDDGVGFDPRLVPQDRFGLEGIRQRARLFGSEAEITSAPDAGTIIRVTLPLAAAEA